MASKSAQVPRRGKTSTSRPRRGRKAPPVLSVVGGKDAGPAAAEAPQAVSSPAPKHHRKTKRTLTPDNLVRTLSRFIRSGWVLTGALIRPKTSPALREKVVLGVTSVNDCRYCKWGHTHWAMAHGVSLDEVNQILGHETEALKALDPAEAAAILFAQHYAEHHDQIDPESIENLRKYYSNAQIDEIIAYIRAITLGNLAGNTVDAFLGRFRSHGHTSIFFEGIVTALASPALIAVTILSAFDREVRMDKMRLPRL